MNAKLADNLSATAFAFRGYNISNQGRSAELLAHPVYGRLVEQALREVSQVCSDTLNRPVDLVERVAGRRDSSLDTFAEDIGMIVAMEVAQIKLLEQFHGLRLAQARFTFGYSLGEITALVCGGLYTPDHVLPPLVAMAGDCAELARNVTMGVVFSRGAELDMATAQRLCLEICREGRGIVAVSSQLAPNTVLILGQGETIDRFRQRMPEQFSNDVLLRKNRERWPPLHTPILWERNVPCRAGRSILRIAATGRTPKPAVISLVTGKPDYNDFNSVEMIHRWIDHPQRLWDAIYHTFAEGIETVVHVGPAPNLIPSTYRRISENVAAQLQGRSLNSLGLRAMSSIWRPWLARWLSARSALLRAPFIRQVILEDWLLEQKVA